jgi:hypothetical protein
MVMMLFVVDHFVVTIEIDKDKNSVVQLIDNNIVEKDEYVENMLLFHQQITKNARKQKEKQYLFFARV